MEEYICKGCKRRIEVATDQPKGRITSNCPNCSNVCEMILADLPRLTRFR